VLARFDYRARLGVEKVVKREILDTRIHLVCFVMKLWVLDPLGRSSENWGVRVEHVVGPTSLCFRHAYL
jgi:hypothetical protein